MHILQICHGLPPESVGGVEQHTEGLVEALVRLGHRVHVYARTSDPSLPQGSLRAERAGNPAVTRAVYRWENVTDLASMYECEPMASTLRAFLQQQQDQGARFDVAHVHHLTGMSTRSLAVLREFGIPVVMTLHDYWLMCPRGQMWSRREEACLQVEEARCGECLQQTFPYWTQGKDHKAMARGVHERALAVLQAADRLVIPSARAIGPFAALGVAADQITVVENGVDTERLEQLPPPPCGPGPLRLCSLGTVIPSKGLHVLIEAVLRQPPGAVELHVYGNAVNYHGDSSYPLRCFGQLRPKAEVHYHGPYTTAELPGILAGVDVVCAPALWHEAFGLTVREAAAAGRPILVSRIGGLQDAVQDGQGGRVLPPGDVAAWAAAIAELAQDRAKVRAMAKAVRQQARGFLPMAQDLLRVYAEAAQGPGRA